MTVDKKVLDTLEEIATKGSRYMTFSDNEFEPISNWPGREAIRHFDAFNNESYLQVFYNGPLLGPT